MDVVGAVAIGDVDVAARRDGDARGRELVLRLVDARLLPGIP